MLLAVKKNRELTGKDIFRDKELNPHNVSISTINRMLKEEGFKARRPSKIHFITDMNKLNRLIWCKVRSNWTLNRWRKVIFSDESLIFAEKFQIRWIRRCDGEDLGEEYCDLHSRWHNGIRILVWAAITSTGPLAL
jgi:hypothetical protein